MIIDTEFNSKTNSHKTKELNIITGIFLVKDNTKGNEVRKMFDECKGADLYYKSINLN